MDPRKECFLGQGLELGQGASESHVLSSRALQSGVALRSQPELENLESRCRSRGTKLLGLMLLPRSLSQPVSLTLMPCSLDSLKII